MVKSLGNDPSLRPVVALHQQYADQITKLKTLKQADADFEKVIRKAAQAGKKGEKAKQFIVTKTMKDVQDGWEEVAGQLLDEADRVAVNPKIAEAFRNLEKSMETHEFFKAVDKMTQFFKTYATMSPGFHIRNALSAAFMNFSDGVRLADHQAAFSAWKKYEADPVGYLKAIEKSDPQLHAAFKATFASGAGGSFSAEELGSELGSRWMHNWATKKSRQAGEWVEGPARLAMAINSTRNGGDVFSAMNRVSRIHFDYSQLSKLDRGMKRLVPFWTFMSRNLPLQIQQQWTRPGVYSIWNHFHANVSQDIENTPQWMQRRDPIGLGINARGGEWALMPDLPMLNAGAEFEPFLTGDPKVMMSAMNPMLTAPLEAWSNERFRFGSEIGDGGDRVEHLAMQMLPPFAQAQRLLGTGRYKGQNDEKILNYLGVPLQKITPQEQANEAKRRRRDGKP